MQELSSRLPPVNKINFGEEYGNLLNLLNEEVDPFAVLTLAQFFDPPLRCFAFQDFYLAPILEDFEHITSINKKIKVPFSNTEELLKHEITANALHMHKRDMTPNLETEGNTQEFTIKFWVEKAPAIADANNWEAWNAVLAMCIYGIVLFPNIDDFIDMTNICIFLTKNSAPHLLDDVYYFLKLRHEKREVMVLSYALLLYKWLLSHLPKKGPFVEQHDKLGWPQRMVSLRVENISWYSREYNGIEIIFSCVDFPNIPLI